MSDSTAIPVAPGAVPLLGHLPPLARDPLKYLDTLFEHGATRGGLLTLRLGAKKMVVVCDPLLTHEMLVRDKVFDKGGPFFEAGWNLMPTAMGFAPYSKHRRLKQMMLPSFTKNKLASYSEIMVKEITTALAGWRDGEDLEIVTELMAVTGRVLVATMFSTSVSEETLQEVMADSLELTRGMLVDTALPGPLRWLTPGYGRYRKAVARVRETTLRLIDERMAEGEKATEYGDLLSALLAGTTDTGDRFSRDELVDQLSFMMVAGTETTAQTVSWLLYELSRRPELQDALVAELDEVLEGREATFDDVRRLELTNRLLNETLRFYSPSWLFTRVATEDTKLGDYAVPAKTDILYSPYIIDRAPGVHQDARSFDPDRWLPERAECMHKQGYIPFGTAARKCIGDQFSLVESALVLVAIVRHWRIEPVPGSEPRPSRKIVNTPGKLRLRAVARTAAAD